MLDQKDIANKISEGLVGLNIKAEQETVNRLVTLIDLLASWNQKLNLTAIKAPQEMVVLHILDSAALSPLLPSNISTVADVGTGAGFPGLVLATLNPKLKFTLIDSIAKKLSIVRMAALKMGLENVEIVNKRVEEIKDQKFDLVVSRAFAPLGRMCNWCLPILKEQGLMIAMKANLTEQEYKDVPHSVKIEEIVDLFVPMLDAKRQAVFIRHS